MQGLVGDLRNRNIQEYHLMLLQPQSNLSLRPGLNTERPPGWTGRCMKDALTRNCPGMPG